MAPSVLVLLIIHDFKAYLMGFGIKDRKAIIAKGSTTGNIILFVLDKFKMFSLFSMFADCSNEAEECEQLCNISCSPEPLMVCCVILPYGCPHQSY